MQSLKNNKVFRVAHFFIKLTNISEQVCSLMIEYRISTPLSTGYVYKDRCCKIKYF